MTTLRNRSGELASLSYSAPRRHRTGSVPDQTQEKKEWSHGFPQVILPQPCATEGYLLPAIRVSVCAPKYPRKSRGKGSCLAIVSRFVRDCFLIKTFLKLLSVITVHVSCCLLFGVLYWEFSVCGYIFICSRL